VLTLFKAYKPWIKNSGIVMGYTVNSRKQRHGVKTKKPFYTIAQK